MIFLGLSLLIHLPHYGESNFRFCTKKENTNACGFNRENEVVTANCEQHGTHHGCRNERILPEETILPFSRLYHEVQSEYGGGYFDFRIFTSEFSLQISHFRIFTSQYSLQNCHFRISTSEFALQNSHFALLTSQCSLHNFHFTIFTSQSRGHNFGSISLKDNPG